MTDSGHRTASGLRLLPVAGGREPLAVHAGFVVHGPHRLGELVHRRPVGITGHQWTSALLQTYDLVVGAYVLDAWTWADGVAEVEAGHDPPMAFWDILGRLPDGRTGAVNDLGALARAAAVEAYVEGRLADPIVRGLHVRWTDGPAEGWSWVEVRPGECLLERVTVREHRSRVGVDPGRLAEDLAALAIGERLRTRDVDPAALVRRAELRSAIRALAARRDDLDTGFAFDHLCAD